MVFEPISAALTGIAILKSVDFIKSNIATANDIKDIAGALDGLFAGEKQVKVNVFDKSMLGQTKDAASKVIDAKLAQAMDEMRVLINHRLVMVRFNKLLRNETTVTRRKRTYCRAKTYCEEESPATQRNDDNDWFWDCRSWCFLFLLLVFMVSQ